MARARSVRDGFCLRKRLAPTSRAALRNGRARAAARFERNATMRVRVDHAADAVYINLTDRPIDDSEEVVDGIVVDYDDEGRIVGIEILDAAKHAADPTALKHLSFKET
jgi:uncharacterized protein YuzE